MFLMCNYICTVCISSVINAASSPGLRIPIEIGNSPGGVSYKMISKVYYCVYAMGIVFFWIFILIFILVIKDGQKYNLVGIGTSLLNNSKGSSPISIKLSEIFAR